MNPADGMNRRDFILSAASSGALLAMPSSAKTLPAPGDSLPERRIGTLFEKAARISGCAGLQLSLIKGSQQLDLVHGTANAELGIPMTRDTVVQIGSTTKVFNATIVLSLVEEGKLDLDVPVKRYIPEFEVADRKATDTLTLRHLLSMSSGLDNGDYRDYGEGADAVAKRVAGMKTLPQHFSPGTHFGYSNAGIDITGHVTERVTGRIWDDLLKERVLQPAGLKNAASLYRDRMFQRASVGHVIDPKSGKPSILRPWDGISRGLAPAGATLTVSAHDLARFGKLFLNQGVADSGTRVLTQDSVKRMMTAHIDVPVHWFAVSWGLGPCMSRWGGVQVWGHHGGNSSGGSFLFWVPGKDAVMACTFNTMSPRVVYERLVKIMTQDVMAAAFGIANPGIQRPSTPVEVDPQRYTGIYESLAGQCRVESLADGLSMTTSVTTYKKSPDDIVRLIPLGDDRFLVDRGPEAGPMEIPPDLAFFGDDGRGRATNMTRIVFPSSRKS